MSLSKPSPLVLVLGATGTTGRRVTARLQQRGVPVRAASRAGVPRFEWTSPSTWSHVLDGVSAMYVCYSPDLAVPEAAATVARLTKTAVASGVDRIVLLSGRGESGASAAEDAVRSVADAGGATWSVVRSAWFAQNFSESFLLDQVLEGTVALPADQVREPFVDVDDVADVATAALLDDGHAGQVYEVTGPELLTFAEAVATIATATGTRVEYRPTTSDEQRATLRAAGVDDDEIWLLDHLFTEVLDGRNAHVADGVRRALGRPPTDFAAYARRAAAAGAWTPSATGTTGTNGTNATAGPASSAVSAEAAGTR